MISGITRQRVVHVAMTEDSTQHKAKIALVALGGNALLQRGEDPTSENQTRHAWEAAKSLAALVREEGYSLCVTHGNGPQIGLLALKAPEELLDVLGAESEGQIGYLLECELSNALPDAEVVSMLTQVLVDPKDPAFQSPSKFIGPMYSKEEAERFAREKGFEVKPDGDKGYRRVVASPQPKQVLEARAIQVLVKEGILCICAGGGGIPVALEQEEGETQWRRHGVEAVIDKDAASALLAAQIKADILLLLTDAPAVFDPQTWPKEKVPVPSPISPDELLQLGSFAGGSMGPKVQAACKFVQETGRPAGIGSMEDAVSIVRRQKGTLITKE
ncbi:g6691 [Coccomyxa elongata]